MKLHQISVSKPKKEKRVGRGGKRGTTAGRGTKGQHSRSGRRIRPAVRDLIQRLPKLRGFRNKPLTAKPFVINLSDLKSLRNRADKGPLALNVLLLKEIGWVGSKFNSEVKLLGRGEIDFPVIVRGIKVSESVKAKIEKAGGRVE